MTREEFIQIMDQILIEPVEKANETLAGLAYRNYYLRGNRIALNVFWLSENCIQIEVRKPKSMKLISRSIVDKVSFDRDEKTYDLLGYFKGHLTCVVPM